MSKYTKGPWEIFTSPSGYKMLRGPNNHRICGDIDGLDCSDEENKANIKLMSLAPELLESLIELYENDLMELKLAENQRAARLVKARNIILKAGVKLK